MRLKRSNPAEDGIKRLRRGKGFSYHYCDGTKVDQGTLARIEKLVIPPAWEDVWICPSDNGHLQAMGTDSQGRRQYLYHQKHHQKQASLKFAHMLEFAEHLPALRETIANDLTLNDYSKAHICAVAVRLLDKGFFRIGSESYAESYGSYGLATIKKDHLDIVEPDQISFEFPAKHQVSWQQTICDPEIFNTIQTLKRRRSGEMELLAYKDNGQWRDITSNDINNYIDQHSTQHFTAKDFRTWHATVLAGMSMGFMELSEGISSNENTRKKQIAKAVKEVSFYLHNTPAVCRSSYIDPSIWDRYHSGVTIAGALQTAKNLASLQDTLIQQAIETAVYELLTGHSRRGITRKANQILKEL